MLSPELLGTVAVAAYFCMALMPIIQPPIMRLLTTKKERSIRMDPPRQVSRNEKILFLSFPHLSSSFFCRPQRL